MARIMVAKMLSTSMEINDGPSSNTWNKTDHVMVYTKSLVPIHCLQSI
jgi:hypothetical protein